MVSVTSKQYKAIRKPSTAKLIISLTVGVVLLSLLFASLLYDITSIILRSRMRVAEGQPVFQYLTRETEHVHIMTYLFNITNAEEFTSGADHKLKVQEVGPFTYREIRKNQDVELDLDAGVVRFSPVLNLTFSPEDSVGRPEDVIMVMPNIPMLGTMSRTNDYGLIARLGFSVLANQLQSKPIVKIDASSYMWGYKEPLLSLVHNFIPGFITFEKMGILERISTKDPNRLELSAIDETKFMIKKRNGYKKLPMSTVEQPEECEMCSTFEDSYEGMVYPTSLTPDFHLRLFRNGLCRIFDMEYNETRAMPYGADALVYHLSDSFYKPLDPNKPSNGILELRDCFYGMPLALSNAHFLDMDPKIYERIEGIQADENKDRIYVTIEPSLGIQVETYFSVQMNLVIGDLTHNAETEYFSNMVIPICIIQIVQPPLVEETMNIIRFVHSTLPYIILIVQMVLWLLTFMAWAYFIGLLYRYCAYSEESVLLSKLAKQPNVVKVDELLANGKENSTAKSR